MTKYELDIEATKEAVKNLPPRYPKDDPRNIDRIAKFMENYEKAKKEILEEEHD